jgi:predicted RNase H-like nuclease
VKVPINRRKGKGKRDCIIGVDLAWGDKKPDGMCVIDRLGERSRVVWFGYPQGDDAFLESVQGLIQGYQRVLMTVDAPIVCPNRTGTRPVDRLTHRMFHREHAACHPANSTKCPRPPRIRRKLVKLGFKTGWDMKGGNKIVAEVYPHPAMVRLFRLPRIVKYKKGKVAERKKEFQRLQKLMRRLLKEEFSGLSLNAEARGYLRQAWSKRVEDHLDAFFCALIGLWHLQHQGRQSTVIGDLKTGFILLPEISH